MKIGLIGYGKMGKKIEEIVNMNKKDKILWKLNSKNIQSFEKKSIEKPDVIIEFTNPHSVLDNIRIALKKEIPIVIGTTGWHDQLIKVEDWVSRANGSLFYASNFSIGVHLFRKINTKLAKLMDLQKEYEVSIKESHHLEKKDAPSGTAITLAKEILEKIERKDSWSLPSQLDNPNNLTIQSVREEDVKGIHIIKYSSEVDLIEIKHEAKSRDGFAIGAIKAANWLQSRKGLFTMEDMIP